MKFLSCTARLLFLAVLASTSAKGETLRTLTGGQFVTNLPFDVQLASAKDIGLRRARIGIRIYEVEKAGGHYDWSTTDMRIRGLKAAGLTPIITLFGRSRLIERAAASADGRVALSEPEIGAFANFAAQVVQRYGTIHDGRNIIYEIWNEPNTKTFWGSPPDPEAYARLAETTCRAIREKNQAATVVGLAMEGTPLNKPYHVRAYGLDIYREWAARAATPQLMQCLSGISVHPYRREPETYIAENASLVQFVSEHWKKSEAPLIVNSEWGYSVGAKNAVDLEDQAALDLRMLLIGTGLGRITNIYQLVNAGPDQNDVRHMYGLFDLNGSPKPAGSAVLNLLKAIGDFEIEGVASVPEMPGVFRFKAHRNGPNRQEAVVLWRQTGETTVSPPDLGFGRPTIVRDLVSNRDHSSDGSAVTVAQRPVLLLFGAEPKRPL